MNKSNAMSVVLKNNAQLLKKRRHEKAWSIVPKSKMKTTESYDADREKISLSGLLRQFE